ncbi:MAG: hypothetical protein ABI838_10600, partial [Chloroflexota bacterium]
AALRSVAPRTAAGSPRLRRNSCGIGGPSVPTGRTYIYDLAAASEAPSRLTGVFDVWPHLTAPPSFG